MNFESFRNPGNIHRPIPFWAINDRLKADECGRQMADFIRVGLGGGFFHARAGLVSDYMGAEWMAAMDGALAAAKENDGYLWLYDEDRWPSGTAGGGVTEGHPELAACTLRAELLAAGAPVPAETADSLLQAAYAIDRSGAQLRQARRLSPGEAAADTMTERLVFLRVLDPPPANKWMNARFANLLDPKAVARFIELTHEVYRQRFGGEFGRRVPGIFTDEPHMKFKPDALAWYDGLPQLYAAWHGRDFWADLPWMHFEGPDARLIRLLIHRTVHRQYCTAFSRQIFEWCEKHGIAFTGHYNAEDNFHGQIANHGGGVMAHYRYQHIPGMDHLMRRNDPWLVTARQVSSAAGQLGRTHTITEIFGVTRHTNTFEHFKWLADHDLANGLTLLCPHLSWYSCRGRRKRDFPPNWNYQQSYWDDLRLLNDYFARVGFAISSGQRSAEILLLQPMDTAVASHRLGVAGGGAPLCEQLDELCRYSNSFTRMLAALLHAGFETDIGDETLIAELGAIDQGRFRIGKMSYKVVVVPSSRTWRPRTLELLQQFSAAGGTIIFLGELPTETDCRDAREPWSTLLRAPTTLQGPASGEHLVTQMDRLNPQNFTLRDADGRAAGELFVNHRVDGRQETFFIINSSLAAEQKLVLTLRGGAGRPLALWNAFKGTREALETWRVGSDARYEFTLPPAGSILLVAGENALEPDALRPAGGAPPTPQGPAMALNPHWSFERSEENVLVLDRLAVSTDQGVTWWDEDLDFRQRRRLANHFGLPLALHWQPWQILRGKATQGKGGPCALRYSFVSDLDRPRCFAVIEDLRRGRLVVNGQEIDTSGATWHWDRDFGKVEITPHVRRGINTLEFHFQYDFLTEVEQAYVVGDFAVVLTDPRRGKIVAEPVTLADGPWGPQGYPFYSGAMTYRGSIPALKPEDGRLLLRLCRPSGVLFKVRLNGKDLGAILGRPYSIDLTPALRGGANLLEIVVVSSRQNTMGPLHDRDGEDNECTGPDNFESESYIREELSLFDYGLLGGAELVSVPKPQHEEQRCITTTGMIP